MLSKLTIASYCMSVSAAPWGPGSWGTQSRSPSFGQEPFKFPLPNGFPNVQVPSTTLLAIEQQAHGTLPNGALPTSLSDASATTFQAIAFGELFEVAYFTSLINNITNTVPGYEIGSGAARSTILDALVAIQAQEELHAIGVNTILASAKRTPVQACEYIFPVDNFEDAIKVASQFTDAVVLGGLQDALGTFSTDGDAEVVPLLTSVVGQEGEQNGFFRSLEGHIPSALPFLTRSAGPFAYSFMNQRFIVPGTCPSVINVPVFRPLTVSGECFEPRDQQVEFTFTKKDDEDPNTFSVVYINQQNTPIVQKIENAKVDGDSATFRAQFPYQKYLMNGLTIVAVTKSGGPFTSVDDVANATLFGPGIIEIN